MIPYTWRIPGVYRQILRLPEIYPTDTDVKKWQLFKLQNIINHAYTNVPGYYQLYSEAGVKPSDIHSLSDINYLPFIDKDTIRNNIKDFTSRKVDRYLTYITSTSGSSGHPFAFARTRHEEWIEQAFVAKCWSQGGWNLKQSGIVLRGAYSGNNNNIYKKCDNSSFYAHNDSYYVSPNFITQEYYHLYIDFLKKHSELSYIFALPSTIALLSKFILDNNDCEIRNIRAVYLSSEPVFPWQYEVIKAAFPRAAIISLYGMTEHVIFAYWSKFEQLYHIDPFYGFTEMYNGDEQPKIGERCELVGTSFWMTTTPFIRYKTRDYAIKSMKKGLIGNHNYEVIESIEGRLQDVLIGKTGRYIAYNVFDGSLLHGDLFRNILQYKIVQKELGKISIYILPNSKFQKFELNNLQTSVTNYLGEDFECNIEITNHFSKGPNGKFNIVEQHLPLDSQNRLML